MFLVELRPQLDNNGIMEMSPDYWKLCSSCKKPIAYQRPYYECSVTTCTGRRTGYVFCSVFCWERHLPGAKHRDASAIEKTSPSLQAWKQEIEAPKRIIVQTSSNPSTGGQPAPSGFKLGGHGKTSVDHEVLVVVSKMKTYIKEKADMNTSGDVADWLSDLIRRACDDAIDAARADGRKTVMARDFKS